MKVSRISIGLALAAAALSGQDFVWAPKPAPDPYTGPHRPHTKYADLKARHASQAEWSEAVVDDDLLHSEFIQRKPGYGTPRAFYSDTRAWWVVMEGEVRFEIEGTEPFVAKRRAIVQVPMQTIFSWQVVGDKPALMLATKVAKAKLAYVNKEDAPKLPGVEFVRARTPRLPGRYLHKNKPLTTFEEVAQALESGALKGTQKIVEDDRGAANHIYGYEKNLAKLNLADRGHFHTETPEFWLILAGEIRYRIEGQEVFIAKEGDMVYVPRNTWHLARWYGSGPSCRLAMNGYPNLIHFYDPEVSVPGNK